MDVEKTNMMTSKMQAALAYPGDRGRIAAFLNGYGEAVEDFIFLFDKLIKPQYKTHDIVHVLTIDNEKDYISIEHIKNIIKKLKQQ